MRPLDVVVLPCLADNYGFLVRDVATGAVAAVDSPDAAAIDAALDARGWRLTHLLNTHHHGDHTGGNRALVERWGCRVYGPRGEAGRIPGLDVAVGDGDRVLLGATEAVVLDVPGHTAGHVAWSFPSAGVVFVGDTLFSLGCGRLFEGTAAQMWASLSALAALPDDTVVYCAHEYTQSNARFARSILPDDAALAAFAAEVDDKRARGEATVPTTIGAERAVNPFLRAAEPTVAAAVGLAGAPPVDVFAEVRRRKDGFRG